MFKSNEIGVSAQLILIAGPCALENERVVMESAEALAKIAADYPLRLIFKSSFEKDNRTVADAYRGPGLKKGLELLIKVKEEFHFTLLTDVHRIEQVLPLNTIVDVIQIPAFLTRQTSLLEAVGTHAKAINIKKAQWMAPEDMHHVISKLERVGADDILLTERGTQFGFDRLIVDPTAIKVLKETGKAVAIDAGHSSNRPEDIITIANAGLASGADALFIETHPNPKDALCDGKRMLSLNELKNYLPLWLELFELMKETS